jgi:uncharacterized RDD family membrane protein YckC
MVQKRELLPKRDNLEYPGLQTRLMANLIDSLIFVLFLFPVFAIMGNIIYGDLSPAQLSAQLTVQMEELAKIDKNFSPMQFLQNNPEIHNYFYKNHGLLKVCLDFFLQLTILAGLYLFFWIKKQATIGKRVLSLKIVDATTLKKPSNKQFFIRMLALFVSIVPVFLGIIWIAFDPKKQGWHDKIANTLVIKEK